MAPHSNIAVVVNPRAANGRVGKRWPALKPALRDALGGFKLLRTERPGHATELVQNALREGFERIVSVGGDGTHNEVVNGFFDGQQPINPEASLALVPYGTGGDLERTLGVPRGLDAIPHILDGIPAPSDIGRATYTLPDGGEATRYFINVADFGIGGAVVKRVNQTTKFFGGFASFLYGVVATVLTYRNPWLRLEIDGESIEGRCNNVIVANGQYYGGGMHVAPEARLDSGVFEIFVIGDVSRIEAIRNIPRLYKGTLADRPDLVQHLTASRITARSDEPVLLNLEGEQPGQLPVAIDLLPGAINLVTP